MRGTAGQVAARLRARAARAQRVLEDELARTLQLAAVDAAASTPVDTGDARRSWRVVPFRGGHALANDRPRSRFLLGGRLLITAVRVSRKALRTDKRRLARALKEG